MSAHHVELPEQVVTPGEELWVKIIDLDLQRRRISLSIKQAAEGGVVAAEYQEHFGEHAYDDQGNYVGSDYSEGQEAWEEYFAEHGGEAPVPVAEGETPEGAEATEAEATEAPAPAEEPVAAAEQAVAPEAADPAVEAVEAVEDDA